MRQATKYEPNNKKKYKNHAHAKNRKKIEQNKIISLIHVKTKLEPVICKSFCSTLKFKFKNYVHKDPKLANARPQYTAYHGGSIFNLQKSTWIGPRVFLIPKPSCEPNSNELKKVQYIHLT